MSSNRFWPKAVLSLVATGSLAVLTACGSPSVPAADTPGKTPTAKGKTKAPNTKAADKAADKKGDQRIANYSFEKWDEKTPHRWIAEPAEKVSKATGEGQKGICAELKPSDTGKYTILRQRLSESLAGKKITVTLRAKSFEAKMLSAKFSFETKSGPQTVILDAAGHGAWESVTRTVTIPADTKANSGMLAIVLRPGAKKSAFVDYITISAQ